MTAYTGTNTYAKPGAGEIGRVNTFIGKYTFAAEIENTDTITWDNILPEGKKRILDFEVWGVELDTNATPTATFTVGDGSDADGFLTTKGGAVGLQNSLAGQLWYKGDGALIGTLITTRDVVLTVTAATATGASSGDVWIKVVTEAV